MSVCQLTLQEHIEGISSTDKFAIVPDIQIYSFGSDLQGSKRYRSDSDISFGEEDLDLLGQDQQLQLNSYSFQEPKRHCSGYSISCPSPDQFQLVENTTSTALCSEVFSPQVQETYDFGASKDTNIFTCGGNSPVSSASSPSAANFAATRTQAPAACQQVVDFQSLVPIEFLPDMQRQPQTVLSQLSQHTEKYELVITEQPEEYYRARYCSEGVRAPLKGMTENFPTVQVFGPEFRYGRIDVKLVHADGTSHTSCSLDTSEGRKNAVTKKIGPFNHMIAEFEDLRIRRVKKEGRKKTTNVEKATPKDGRSDKVASLLFTATVETEQGELVQSIQSKPISLTTAPEPAELDWLEPNRGHFAGQEPLVVKGSKMTSPKVTFRIVLPDGRRQELHGSVDKERSHQNVLLVKTPSLTQMSYQFPHQTIRAEVVVITGRNQMSSNALQFDFIPNHICRECMQETPRQAHLTGTYSVCSPSTYSAPGATATRGPGHSPPPTPGLSATQQQQQQQQPQPQPSPSPVVPQIQPPTHIHLQQPSSYSIPSTPLSVSNDPMVASPRTPEIIRCPTVPPQESAVRPDKSGDEFNGILMNLMAQDCYATSMGLNMHDKDIDATTYLYGSPQASYSQHGVQQSSSPYIPVTSPSASSDQPCYSPVTPVQSPSSSAPWSYIEQMLTSLLQNEQISRQGYRFLTEECVKQNPVLLQAFNTSRSNEGVFLQLLAPYGKPEQVTFQATHQ